MRFMIRKSIKSVCAVFTTCYKPHIGKRNKFSKLSAQSSCPDLQKVEQGDTRKSSSNENSKNKRSGKINICCPPELFMRLKLKIRRKK
jgi:hypothetical protein